MLATITTMTKETHHSTSCHCFPSLAPPRVDDANSVSEVRDELPIVVRLLEVALQMTMWAHALFAVGVRVAHARQVPWCNDSTEPELRVSQHGRRSLEVNAMTRWTWMREGTGRDKTEDGAGQDEANKRQRWKTGTRQREGASRRFHPTQRTAVCPNVGVRAGRRTYSI